MKPVYLDKHFNEAVSCGVDKHFNETAMYGVDKHFNKAVVCGVDKHFAYIVAYHCRRLAPAPWAELVGKHMTFYLPSEGIRDLDDPGAALKIWDTAVSPEINT